MASNKGIIIRANLLFIGAITLCSFLPVILLGLGSLAIENYASFSTFCQNSVSVILILLYTLPIWAGMGILSFLTDLFVIPLQLRVNRFTTTEWFILMLVPIWPLVDNFSLEFPSRWVGYIYFILISFSLLYLKNRYLIKRGVIIDPVS